MRIRHPIASQTATADCCCCTRCDTLPLSRVSARPARRASGRDHTAPLPPSLDKRTCLILLSLSPSFDLFRRTNSCMVSFALLLRIQAGASRRDSRTYELENALVQRRVGRSTRPRKRLSPRAYTLKVPSCLSLPARSRDLVQKTWGHEKHVALSIPGPCFLFRSCRRAVLVLLARERGSETSPPGYLGQSLSLVSLYPRFAKRRPTHPTHPNTTVSNRFLILCTVQRERCDAIEASLLDAFAPCRRYPITKVTRTNIIQYIRRDPLLISVPVLVLPKRASAAESSAR